MRGEDQRCKEDDHELLRNTPTCVGKTANKDRFVEGRQKHPHVRGDDECVMSTYREESETPPRAWGRHPKGFGIALFCGNTPTCVGKTRTYGTAKGYGETPPRAWGRLKRAAEGRRLMRNTPTCVGKTFTIA